MAKNKLNSEIKIRCYSEEKEWLKNLADQTGLKMSDFVRSVIFSDKKLILLTEGSEIAKSLFLIHNDLEYFRNSGGVPKESIEALTAALEDVAVKVNSLSAKLSDIHADNEEADEDE